MQSVYGKSPEDCDAMTEAEYVTLANQLNFVLEAQSAPLAKLLIAVLKR